MSGRPADRWRKLLKIDPEARREIAPRGGLESIEAPADDPFERIEVAREAMIRQIEDHFGRDPALLKAVEELAITSEEAIEILDSMPDVDPSPEQISSLEAIVMFDGTRPSFLVKDHQIDFASSYNTGPWQTELQPHLHALTRTLPCIGRVELGERHIGTAFLVTTTLAITNRHVAQSIARFDGDQIVLKPNTFLDFGREQWNGKTSFDRRRVESIVFAGSAPVAAPIDHKKLDLAVVRVSESKLDGDQRNRSLSTTSIGLDEYLAAGIVAAAGYPASPDLYVPTTLKSKYDAVLNKLLEGEGGAKRFAPGSPSDFMGGSGPDGWTLCHDATTINGNSGSPLFLLGHNGKPENVALVGLHYGGDWGGERINWAHRLSATGNAAGYGTALTFSEFCRAEGIAL